MDVRWEEAGWERLTGRTGRRRLPVWDCTVGLVVGDDSVLLVDPGSCVREGAEVRAEAERLTGRRVTHIAFTHGHFDHVLGGAAFSGAEFFGAVGLDALLTVGRDELRGDAVRHGLAEAEAAEAADLLAAPKHLVSGEWTLDLGGVQVLLANVGPRAHPARPGGLRAGCAGGGVLRGPRGGVGRSVGRPGRRAPAVARGAGPAAVAGR
ncbi:hypothetical protein GCM10020254_55990 [Streptomyces goshikiensis]